jgi:indolepyruvate ferredoxin oxidoreductase alpha subunit
MNHEPPSTLRGDQALARGALAAGVRVVSGYPGSPATGVLEAIVAATPPGQVEVGWAPNEKVALELAFGASLGGARSLVVLKSVGLNIALDPLATMSLSGCNAGLVILLGDDPGGWGSQNEQDSRWLARVAEVPLLEPVNVAQCAALMVQAFIWSEAHHLPVIVRITGALAGASDEIEEPWPLPSGTERFLRKAQRWVVVPANVVARHHTLHRRLAQLQAQLESSPYDLASGMGRRGLVALGYTHAKALQALGDHAPSLRLLGLCSVYPLPEEGLKRWLAGLDQVLVLEEGNPYGEAMLRDLAQRAGLAVRISGRDDRFLPSEGELTQEQIAAAIARLDDTYRPPTVEATARAMPSKVPLCVDCPYRPTFSALLRVMERRGGKAKHIVVGETGCMVRANLPPFEIFDVKYGLGSGLGLGLGLVLSGVPEAVIALVGDSSFFHTDLNAMPYLARLAAARALPLTVVVLDNQTTALTGGQAHPGSVRDERGQSHHVVDLVEVIRGCGVEPTLLSPAAPVALEAALEEALAARALRVLVVRGPCPKYIPTEN